MIIHVTGAGGLVGSALAPFLESSGHAVRRLARDERGERDLAGADAVVHLAGEPIAEGRWTAGKKALIRDSRAKGTRLLCESLARMAAPPKVLVSASAIGFYGSRGDEMLDESSAIGSGFLADVCRLWEAATRPAIDRGIRVVHARFGFVLSPKGGGLARMLTPFRLGVGGKLGDGRQHMSWIAIDDLVRALAHALEAAHESLRGPVNCVSPEPVTNGEFTKALGRVLGRPTFLPMPIFAARLMFGEVADELLLCSQRVTPKKLLASGYEFRWPTIEAALRQLLTPADQPPPFLGSGGSSPPAP